MTDEADDRDRAGAGLSGAGHTSDSESDTCYEVYDGRTLSEPEKYYFAHMRVG